MITMNDIDVILSIPVSLVYINVLVLFNGKLLPTFVNHTIIRGNNLRQSVGVVNT